MSNLLHRVLRLEGFPRISNLGQEVDVQASVDVLVLMASHNRAQQTETAIQSLYDSADFAGLVLHVVLVDSASSDGTPGVVRRKFPEVQIVPVGGDVYWAGAMRRGWESSAHVTRRYEMWLNDDVVLFKESLQVLVETSRENRDWAVIIGSTSDPTTGELTYGGQKLGRWRSFSRAAEVPPSHESQRADIANGNVVLYSEAVSSFLGGFPLGFTHAMADTYFVSKAKRSCIPTMVAPGFSGHCRGNPIEGTWRDTSLPRRIRWRLLHSPKGLLFFEWVRVCFSVGTWNGLRHVFGPAIRVLLGK